VNHHGETGVGRFIDEVVEVTLAGELPEPIQFRWRERDYRILEIQHRWSDWHFGAGSSTRSWRNRRHRNYYRVRTAEGVYELYLDRASRDERSRWILYQQLEAPADPAPGNRT